MYFRPRTNQVFSFKYWGQFADRSIPRPTSYEGPDNSNLNNQQDTDHRLVADWSLYGDLGKWMVRSGYARKNLEYLQRNLVPGLGLIPVVASASIQQGLFNTLAYTLSPDPGFSLEGKADLNLHDVSSRDSVSQTGYEKQRIEMALFLSRK